MTEITVTPAEGAYVVRAGGAVLGETTRALELREGSRAPVLYLPRSDVATAFLERSETATHCPHKGDAAHFHIIGKSGRIEDAAWSYEDPMEQAGAIRGHLAFYPDKATVERL